MARAMCNAERLAKRGAQELSFSLPALVTSWGSSAAFPQTGSCWGSAAASRGVGSWFTLKTPNAEERTLFCPGFNLAKDEWAIPLIFFASLL